MTTPFVTKVRAKGAPVLLVGDGAGTVDVRVQVAELWDVVRVKASPESSVLEVKRAALAELVPEAFAEDYVAKFRGWEVLDEHGSLRDTQITEGSTILLHIRRRQPVK
jgi:hypothetical protein